MKDSVLFVDDEIGILKSVKRLFVNEGVQVMVADNAFKAIDILKGSAVSVIVSDNLMPEMNGIEFLRRAKEMSPESVRILMTAHADVQSSIDAINKGEIYKFILKPWDNDNLMEVIADAVKRYNAVLSMKRTDEATLLSLAQTIELKDPYTRGHCDRVAGYAIRIAKALGLPPQMQNYIKYGSWLHDCGKIGVPEAILNYNGPLDHDQMEIVKKHCIWGADVVRLAQLPKPVIGIVHHHHERYDGSGYPDGLKGEDIPVEVRIVAIADFFDAISTDRPYRTKTPRGRTMELLTGKKGSFFDPEIVDVFGEILREGDMWSGSADDGKAGE